MLLLGQCHPMPGTQDPVPGLWAEQLSPLLRPDLLGLQKGQECWLSLPWPLIQDSEQVLSYVGAVFKGSAIFSAKAEEMTPSCSGLAFQQD